MQQEPLLCCPEDHRCKGSCKEDRTLCRFCDLPVCAECQIFLQKKPLSPMALLNDNFIGFLDPWIYEADVTWMEKTVATPFLTGMTLFSIDRRATHRRQKQSLLDPMYAGTGRVLFKASSSVLRWIGWESSSS